MSFQIRHKEWGVYQGSFLGMGFWHPLSEQPEQGFCEFSTAEDAQSFIDYLSSLPHYRREDFSVEPFDREQSERLISTSVV